MEDYFKEAVAYHPSWGGLRNATAQVFALDDVGFTTPLAITDLNGNPLAGLVTNKDGIYAPFKVVGGATQVNIKSGPFVLEVHSVLGPALGIGSQVATDATRAETARTAAEQARDDAQAVGATNDTIIAANIADVESATRAELSTAIVDVGAGVFAFAKVIDANAQGVVADGITDDAAVWNAIIASASPGQVITWVGDSVLGSKIVWKSGVSLKGEGWGRSVLSPTHATNYFPAISWTPGDGASAANPLQDCVFRDFEIDGSGIAGTAANIAAKGIFAQWLIRCQFLNLYIHDTGATGLGTDFMPECLVDGVVAVNCGRNWDGAAGGHAGIGIGMGAWEEESVTIVNSHAIDCGNWGIFVEMQAGEPYRGRGARVANCTASGCRVGFGDRGTAGSIFSECVAHGNTLTGFNVGYGAFGGRISGGKTYRNGTEGVKIENDAPGPYVVQGVESFENTQRGIYVDGHLATQTDIHVDSCVVHDNGMHGILVDTSDGGLNRGLMVCGNKVYNNGKGGSQTHGIRVDAELVSFLIALNICYDTQSTKTQTAGVKFSDSATYAFTDGRVEGNNLAGNGSAGLSVGSVVRTRVAIRNNTGYVTEGSGTDTIADTTSTKVVTHGLAAAPTSVRVSPRGNEMIWVSARTATTFTVSRAGTAGALSFDWDATLAP